MANTIAFKCKIKYLWIFLIMISTSLLGYMFGLRNSGYTRRVLCVDKYNSTNNGYEDFIQPEVKIQKTFRVVVNRFKEELDWIKDLDANITITVMNKGSPLDKHYFELRPDLEEIKRPNLGRECDGFLSYLVDFYHQLADVTTFVHGDPHYHQEDILQRINELKRRFFAGEDIPHYMSFNKVVTFRCFDEQVDFCCKLNRESMTVLWQRFWPHEKTGMPINPPGCIGGECCAQFAVKRGAIHQHPWEAFRDTLFWIQENGHDYWACYDIEHFWQLLFGNRPILYGIPEQALEEKFEVIQKLVSEWPFQKCELDEWKRKKDAGGTVPIFNWAVPCYDVRYENHSFEEIVHID